MKTKILLLLSIIALGFNSKATTYNISSNSTWTSLASSIWNNAVDNDIIVVESGVTLTINNSTCDETQSTQLIFQVYGTISFNGPGNQSRNLYLHENSNLLLYDNGNITAGNCSENKGIYFGASATPTATCDGNGFAGSSFSDINSAGGLGSSGPLPVEWLEYSAALEGPSVVDINWSTASELNNDRFEVEFSTDATNWEVINTTKSLAENGNSTEVLKYNVKHVLVENAKTVYYRIKQVDFNGDFEYTDLMAVEVIKRDPIVVKTQGNGKATVVVDVAANDEGKITIYDLKGQSVSQGALSSSFEFTVKSAGVYIIEVIKNDQAEVRKQHIL